MSRTAMAALAASCVVLYAMRRHFVFVRPPATAVVSSRAELQTLLAGDCQEDNNDVALLEENHVAFEQELDCASLAFVNYAMFQWWFRAAPKLLASPQDQLRVVRTLCDVVRTGAYQSGGFVVCLKRHGRVVGTCRVALRDCQHTSALSEAWEDAKLYFGFVTGQMHFPLGLMFRAATSHFFQRLSHSIEGMDRARAHVAATKITHQSSRYLHVYQLATHPSAQGTGAGSLLLAAVARVADHLNAPVYLETDTERLRGFYERNGFRVEARYQIPDELESFDINFGMVRWPNAE